MNLKHGKRRYACVLVASITVVLTAANPRAQTGPPLPSVDLRRDIRLHSDVWPGDFNGDGITDLVASRTPSPGVTGVIQVVIGRGDGTFGAPIVSSFIGRAIQVADFNGDRRADVVATPNSREVGAVLLPGNGNGTLGTPRPIDSGFAAVAITSEFTGDNRRDLVLVGDQVKVFPGNGDLTFGTPASLPLPSVGSSTDCLFPAVDAQPCGGGIAGDFDGDGDNDFAVTGIQSEVDVFVNAGSLIFSVNSYTVGFGTTDVTTRDLNADGDLDLIVTTTSRDNDQLSPGVVHILRGGSGATFAPAATYEVARGAFQVVVGDFTRDGRLDIATANRSSLQWPDCGPFRQGSDSVSILPGTTTGFGHPTTFALGDQSIIVTHDEANARFRTSVFSLNTSDLDRDGFTDLIASQGAILLTRAARANRPPVADAGPDVMLPVNDPLFVLDGRASDPDNHLLSFVWTGPESRSGPSSFCFEGGLPDGSHTFTLTVDDGNGGVDQDSTVITRRTNVEPMVRLIQPTAGTVIPAGTPYTIRWEASDETGITHFYVQAILGNNRTVLIPECLVPGTATQCTWRNPMPSENAFLIVVATDTDGGVGLDSTGPIFIRGSVPPNSLPETWTGEDVGAVGAVGSAAFSAGRFTIRGSGADIWNNSDEFQWVYKLTGGNFEISARVDSVQNVNRWVKAGLMMRESSAPGARHVSLFATPTTEKGIAFQRRTTTGGASVHTSGPALAPPVWLRLARVGDVIRAYSRKNVVDPWTFISEETVPGLPYPLQIGLAVSSHVDGRLAEATFSNVSADGLNEFRSGTVGGSQGSASFDGTHYTIDGSGADIWNTSDAFTWASTNFATPDSTFAARVLSIENTHVWAKAGVMVRENGLPDSRHVMVIVSPGKGVAMQWRPTTGGASLSTTPRPGVAPRWVRLVKRTNTFTGYVSSDGMTWVALGTVEIQMPSYLHALVVTSHNPSAVATAVFDEVKLAVP